MVELTGARAAARRSSARRALYAPYTFEAGRALTEPGAAGYNFDAAQGVTYEVDLTRPAGERIVNLVWQGQPLEPDAAAQGRGQQLPAERRRRLRGDRARAAAARARARVREALVDHIRRAGTLEAAHRPLVDRAARLRAARRSGRSWTCWCAGASRRRTRCCTCSPTSRRAAPTSPTGWRAPSAGARSGSRAPSPTCPTRSSRGSTACSSAACSAAMRSEELFQPFAVASLANAHDWCEARGPRRRATRSASGAATASFRRGLLTGTAGALGRSAGHRDTLTRAQALGMVANLRFPTVRVLETTDFHGALLPGAKERRSGRALGGSAVLAAWIATAAGREPRGHGPGGRRRHLPGHDDLEPAVRPAGGRADEPARLRRDRRSATTTSTGRPTRWRARVDEMRFAALGANMLERRTGRHAALGAQRHAAGAPRPARRRSSAWPTSARRASRWPSNVAAPALRRRLGHGGAAGAGAPQALRARTWWSRSATRRARPTRRGARTATSAGSPRVPRRGPVDGRAQPQLRARRGRRRDGDDPGLAGPGRGRLRPRPWTRWPDGWSSAARGCSRTYADEVDARQRDAGAGRGLERAASRSSRPTPLGQQRAARSRATAAASPRSATWWPTRCGRRAGPTSRSRTAAACGPTCRRARSRKGSVYEVIPFDNTLVLVKLTGAEVRRMLEDGLAHGRISQQSGLRYRFDLVAPRGPAPAGASRSPTARPSTRPAAYTVAVNNFMAARRRQLRHAGPGGGPDGHRHAGARRARALPGGSARRTARST